MEIKKTVIALAAGLSLASGGVFNNTPMDKVFNTTTVEAAATTMKNYGFALDYYKQGVKDSAGVKKIQTRLNFWWLTHLTYAKAHGFNSALSVDGAFGPATHNAVVVVQSYYNISRDGIVGPQTWTKI